MTAPVLFYSPWRKTEVTILMPKGTHYFRGRCRSIATSSSKVLEESEGHDPYARGHAQLSRLARRHRLFTLHKRKTEVTIPKPEGSGRVQGGAQSILSSSSRALPPSDTSWISRAVGEAQLPRGGGEIESTRTDLSSRSGRVLRVVKELNPHKQIWSLLS